MISYFFYVIVYPFLLLCGRHLGRKTASRHLQKNQSWKLLGVENGLMGFYALLTSFTLVQSGNHAHEREEMIHTIAIEISEILRVSASYDPVLHQQVRLYFGHFHQIIEKPFGPNKASIAIRVNTIDSMDDAYDATMYRYIQEHPTERDRIAAMLGKTDRMESVYYRLMHSYHRTLPRMILVVLILFSLLISFQMGYIGKLHGNRFPLTSSIFIIMSVIILNIIHDLDTPSFGFLKPDYYDIEEVMHTYRIPG